MIEIKNMDGWVIYTLHMTLKDLVEHAVEHNDALIDADLRGADLRNAYIPKGKFTGSNFAGADLSGCTATRADFSRSNLHNVCFSGSILISADFTGADLTGAAFEDCITEGTIWPAGYDPTTTQGEGE